MAIKKGTPQDGEALVLSASTPGGEAPANEGSGNGTGKHSSASVMDSPYDQNAMDAAKRYGAIADTQRLSGSSTVQNADTYMQGRQEANAAPTSLQGKYNVTGVGANSTNRLSRLADALNSKKWIYTTANMGFGKEGDPRGGGTVQDIQMPGVNTAEQRQQRRMEEWQGTAATNELNTRQWLSRIAPQLEVARQQSIMQLEQLMDRVQVDTATKALDNYFREAFTQFSTNERLRAAIQLAQTLKGLGGDDVFRTYLAQAYGVAAVSKIEQDLTDMMNTVEGAYYKGDYNTVQQAMPLIAGMLQLYPDVLGRATISRAKGFMNGMFQPYQSPTGNK